MIKAAHIKEILGPDAELSSLTAWEDWEELFLDLEGDADTSSSPDPLVV